MSLQGSPRRPLASPEPSGRGTFTALLGELTPMAATGHLKATTSVTSPPGAGEEYLHGMIRRGDTNVAPGQPKATTCVTSPPTRRGTFTASFGELTPMALQGNSKRPLPSPHRPAQESGNFTA